MNTNLFSLAESIDDIKKILIVFGTRPEAIKMAPVIKQFALSKDKFHTIICVTAQHRKMLDQVLNLFEITPQYDLDVMTDNQTLTDLTAKILPRITDVIKEVKPDLVFVQGDTTTAWVTALAAHYVKTTVAHVEAGLRTKNKYSPFPEEINRRLLSILADFHYAPTENAKINLLKEGTDEECVFVTGNTVIDALKWVVKKHKVPLVEDKWNKFFSTQYGISFSDSKRTILVTGHRRESFGEGFKRICDALVILALSNQNIQIVYPVHLNPNVQEPVQSILKNVKNVFLLPPLDYEPFVFLMNQSYIILTDSGGIQEEAPSLEKPVLVMRDTTERPEGIEAGCAKLVGTKTEKIVEETANLLGDKIEYDCMAKAINPYGDGKASNKIVSILSNVIGSCKNGWL